MALWLLRFPGIGVFFSVLWYPQSGFWHVWSALVRARKLLIGPLSTSFISRLDG